MKLPTFHKALGRASMAIAALSVAAAAQAGASDPAKVSALNERFAVSGQVTPDQLAELKARGFSSVIALRPDGEGPDQPASAQVEAAARRHGMAFAYVPVAPGAIPEEAVSALRQAIEASPGKVLMYCRSGSRAARTWSLAEASRPGGADADAILAAVKASGQSADDLRAAIAERVSAREASGR